VSGGFGVAGISVKSTISVGSDDVKVRFWEGWREEERRKKRVDLSV
jgi:hypothetical protein